MTALGGFRFDLLSRDVRLRLRADADLSQRGVARASGVSVSTISRLLAGQVIGVGPVLRLCKWLGCDPWSFMDEDMVPLGFAAEMAAGQRPSA